jgi:hypothetical protein
MEILRGWGGGGRGREWSAVVFKKVPSHEIFFTIQAYMDNGLKTKNTLILFLNFENSVHAQYYILTCPCSVWYILYICF